MQDCLYVLDRHSREGCGQITRPVTQVPADFALQDPRQDAFQLQLQVLLDEVRDLTFWLVFSPMATFWVWEPTGLASFYAFLVGRSHLTQTQHVVTMLSQHALRKLSPLQLCTAFA